MKEILNRVPALKKITTSLSEPVDVDLTTLVNRKSALQDVREGIQGITSYELFSFGFMMYGFGIFTGMGYLSGLKSGNKFIMSIEAASGVMFIVALFFLVAFIAALAAKVKKWK
jgi:hypothetical protein